jgi:tRNA (guanosine-2'-O-)-methyltransferase
MKPLEKIINQSLNLSVSAAIAVERLADGIRGSGVDWQLDPAERDPLRCLWLARSIPTGSRIVNRYFDERSRE